MKEDRENYLVWSWHDRLMYDTAKCGLANSVEIDRCKYPEVYSVWRLFGQIGASKLMAQLLREEQGWRK